MLAASLYAGQEMTRIREEYEETVKKTRIIGFVCDWCGSEFEENNWRGEGGDRYEIEIRLTTHHSGKYGWEAGGKSMNVEDLCPDCAEKLPGTLKSLGMSVKEGWY